jgi:signal peptidase II
MIRKISFWILILDQVSKYLVSRFCVPDQSVPVIPRVLYLTYIHNPGAAFGFFAHLGVWIRIPFFILITVGAGLVVYAYQRFIPRENKGIRFALGLIWGGALGNFVDRIFRREVIDFIDVERIRLFSHNFPWIFNVADSCITVGLVLIFALYFLDSKREPV